MIAVSFATPTVLFFNIYHDKIRVLFFKYVDIQCEFA